MPTNQNDQTDSNDKPVKSPKKELSDKELEKVSGGVSFGDIQGESTNKDHKDWLG